MQIFTMKMILYNTLLAGAAMVLGPWYAWRILASGKYRKSVGPKLGFHPADTFTVTDGSPRVWIHAVSVGEVNAAAAVVARLRKFYPTGALFLSTSTETGQEAARRLVPEASAWFYFPLDIPWVIRGVMDRVAPDVFVTVETELWPNFIRICSERSVKVVMVNGRLSPRSFRKYRATKFFWKDVLGRMDAAGVISETDGERLRKLGMNPSRVFVLGNTKYDDLTERADPAVREATARLLFIDDDTPMIVAGSTHEGEETLVVDACLKLRERVPGLRLILAPRHVDRAAGLLMMLRNRGCAATTLTAVEEGTGDARAPVIVADVMGRLFSLYSVAAVVFCGGSLVPRGGQNVLEPAAWGKVVLHGPFMDDFSSEGRRLDEAGGGIAVRNGGELEARLRELVLDPEGRRRRGEAGRRVVEENQGAAARYAEMISRSLGL
ncbi:MAG: hypothetical protein AVO39_03145 [delta proteobacterium MLS_D]|jgi:3-deoxy-D-manno-octulosonic-acid transferase|nr:MAG: hypothetical protein AVO39_03145 [delta proteobacterium MLS_D]